MITDPKGQLTLEALLPAQSVTANTNSAIVDLLSYSGAVCVVINASAATAGTSPTLDIRLMSGAESNGANATNLNVTATQITTTNSFQTLRVQTDSANRYLKAVATIGGTNSPAFPVSMDVVGVKQYQ